MGQESSLELTGKVKADARAPGGYEVDVTGLTVVHATHDFPITPKEHGTEFLMEHRHLWLRSQRQHAIMRIRHAVVKAVRDFLDDSGFTLVDTPIFTPAACEGTTTLFDVPLLRRGHGVPHAERPALQRGERGRARQGLLLRPDLPRGEVEDPAAPHRVLDGRAGDRLRAPDRTRSRSRRTSSARSCSACWRRARRS